MERRVAAVEGSGVLAGSEAGRHAGAGYIGALRVAVVTVAGAIRLQGCFGY